MFSEHSTFQEVARQAFQVVKKAVNNPIHYVRVKKIFMQVCERGKVQVNVGVVTFRLCFCNECQGFYRV